jgi:hypothetical protein
VNELGRQDKVRIIAVSQQKPVPDISEIIIGQVRGHEHQGGAKQQGTAENERESDVKNLSIQRENIKARKETEQYNKLSEIASYSAVAEPDITKQG